MCKLLSCGLCVAGWFLGSILLLHSAQTAPVPTPAGTNAATPAAGGAAESKKETASPAATAAPATNRAPIKVSRKGLLGPLPAGVKAVSSHSAYDSDKEDCSGCHKNKDPKDPGAITKAVNEGCAECHEDIDKLMKKGKFKHAAAEQDCTLCHNPHESKFPKLLVEAPGALCAGCHESISLQASNSPVKHAAMTSDKLCSNCHNPHASDVEHVLVQLPFEMCIKCHNRDDLKDPQGRKLTNFKTLLDSNPEWHGPVAAKDCSACHDPHGSANFRLLNTAYPAEFYSSYDPKLYANCFECHNDTMVTTAETTTETMFRNGSHNLHYLHVNKTNRGRTCRACHEVHAAKQKHQIRDAVPYGPKGWLLPVNFTATPMGGSCERTCHSARAYTNKVATLSQKP